MAAAQGDVVVIQDADMEYDPRDLRMLLQPILEDEADVVYGSRFIHNDRPVSPLWHQGANQLITFCAALAAGYRFTDVETCYKMFRRELMQDIVPTLREKRFGIEIELTLKLVQAAWACVSTNVRSAMPSVLRGRQEDRLAGWDRGALVHAAVSAFCARRTGSLTPRFPSFSVHSTIPAAATGAARTVLRRR